MKIVWRRRAEHAFLQQLDFVRARNQRAAERLQVAVENRMELLALYPEMGTLSRNPSVRELIIARTPYVAVYQIDGDVITILQFFHTSQDR